MAANPQILSDLHNYVFEKIGRPVTGGNPPTGGDGKKPTDKNARIPLPDYNDLKSRGKYATAVKEKYKLPSGYGDTFLHLNEVPDTRTDSLTSKQIALKAAKIANIPAPLLHASSMVEGMSGLYPYGKIRTLISVVMKSSLFPGMSTLAWTLLPMHIRAWLRKAISRQISINNLLSQSTRQGRETIKSPLILPIFHLPKLHYPQKPPCSGMRRIK